MKRSSQTNSTVNAVADQSSIDRHNGGKQIAWALVPDSYRPDSFEVVVGSAGAAKEDTTVPVEPLPGAISSGTALSFGGNKFAVLTADAAKGADELTVAAIPAALVAGDKATVAGKAGKQVPAFTVMVSVADGAHKGKAVPRAVRPASEEASFVLETNAAEDIGSSYVGFGAIVGGVFFENLMPDFNDVAWSTYKSELKTNGTGFVFQTYRDSRAS